MLDWAIAHMHCNAKARPTMRNKFRAPIGRTLLNAIEEFEELEERYNFLKGQHDDLDNSQFIIVTHSKRTMARADVMYGVTMEEFGVSKPVGMRLTADDGMGNKTEAKSAAQKAALRLDA